MTSSDSPPSLLLRTLLRDPARFVREGNENELLQCYFDGLPLDTLRPVLRHDDPRARQAAAFVVSELGSQAEPLLDDIVGLIGDDSLHTRWYALESVMVCSCINRPQYFVHVVREFSNDAAPIRRLAMRLASKAIPAQIAAALSIIETIGSDNSRDDHRIGLIALGTRSDSDVQSVSDLLRHSRPIPRKYGAVGAKLMANDFPWLLTQAAESPDDDVRAFAEDALNTPQR